MKALQSFLGFCNFYHGFIHDYSEITVPLTNLTKKNTQYIWSTACQRAFEALKAKFETAEVVHHFDQSKPVIVKTDASDYAIGGIISQDYKDGQHPVGFYSRKLRTKELNYDTHNKELLAIMECFWAWRHWTMETPFFFRTTELHSSMTQSLMEGGPQQRYNLRKRKVEHTTNT